MYDEGNAECKLIKHTIPSLKLDSDLLAWYVHYFSQSPN